MAAFPLNPQKYDPGMLSEYALCVVFRAYMCLCAWVRLSVCVQVRAQAAKGGPLLTQPEPLRAFNRRCYLVSQVLRLCCSNATGAKTLPCTRWLCASAGEAARIDLIEPRAVFMCCKGVSCCFRDSESGQCCLLSMHCQIPHILWSF